MCSDESHSLTPVLKDTHPLLGKPPVKRKRRDNDNNESFDQSGALISRQREGDRCGCLKWASSREDDKKRYNSSKSLVLQRVGSQMLQTILAQKLARPGNAR
ncbi:hypothetical protein ACFE04_011186 [Oxalis oulophora]